MTTAEQNRYKYRLAISTNHLFIAPTYVMCRTMKQAQRRAQSFPTLYLRIETRPTTGWNEAES